MILSYPVILGEVLKMTLDIPLPLAIIVYTNLGGENGLLSRVVS